jgi:hypothetical protein
VSRSSKIALVVTGLVALCLLGTVLAGVTLGSSLSSVIGCPDAAAPTVGLVVDRPQQIKERFPSLGTITAVHWQNREARPRTCPQDIPMTYTIEGFLVLEPSDVVRLRQVDEWQPADPPAVAAELAPYAPPHPTWSRSPALDQALDAALTLDAPTGTVFFSYGTA